MCHNSFRQRYVTFLSILKGSIKLLPGKQINRVTVNKNPTDATVCRYLFTARLLYLFRVSQHPSSGVLKTVTAASGTGHNTGAATSLQRGLMMGAVTPETSRVTLQ